MSDDIRVGVIGLGMMGMTHLDAYAALDGVRVVALADRDEDRLHGRSRAGGNIDGQAQGGFDVAGSDVKRFTDGLALIADSEVDVVDICVVTPLHRMMAEAAFAAGKHVLLEKPLARTYADGQAIVEGAKAAGVIAMPAMCIRFWPGWTWLKEAVDDGRYGKLLSATFQRLASHPGRGGGFYADAAACGAAALDLHIHDTDFIQHLLGMPRAVRSTGLSHVTEGVDHILTQYDYGAEGPVISAEGGWVMQEGFPFVMRYVANFEKATAIFDLAHAGSPLKLVQEGETTDVALPEGMGYEAEIAYFVDCLRSGRQPQRVTLQEAAHAVRIVEAEIESVTTRREVVL